MRAARACMYIYPTSYYDRLYMAGVGVSHPAFPPWTDLAIHAATDLQGAGWAPAP
jgi:uncharacterized glyoxalase superfamily metalloenzyme YdcJ